MFHMSQILKLTIPGNPEYIRISKNTVGCAASLAGFDYESIEDIKIAVGEACKNITCHGFAGWAEHYDLVCDIDDAGMRITVTDCDPAHEVKKEIKPCSSCPQEGDLGMCIVESVMDEVQILNDDDERAIVMVKRK